MENTIFIPRIETINPSKMMDLFKEIDNNKYFQELNNVPGHAVYHREGSAMVHTDMVVHWMWNHTDLDNLEMVLVAKLHDIGKIECRSLPVNQGKTDWVYTNHANFGPEVLSRVIDPKSPDFELLQWYLRNHMRPLFWYKREKDIEKFILKETQHPKASIANLALMGLADISGSLIEPSCVEEIKRNEEFLKPFLTEISQSPKWK